MATSPDSLKSVLGAIASARFASRSEPSTDKLTEGADPPAITMAAVAAQVSPGSLSLSGTVSAGYGTVTAENLSLIVDGTERDDAVFSVVGANWSTALTITDPWPIALQVRVVNERNEVAAASRVTSVSATGSGGGGEGTLAFPDATLTTAEDSALYTNVLTGITSEFGPVAVMQFSVTVGPTVNIYGPGVTATITGVGTVSVAANGALAFVPVANYNGTFAGLRVQATDGNDIRVSVTTLVTTAVNDAPVAVDDGGATTVNVDITISPLANDSDVEGSTLVLTHINATAVTPETPIAVTNGTVTPHANGTVTLTPTTGYYGIVTFGYTVSDGTASTTSTVAVLVATEAAPTTVLLPDPVTTARVGLRTWHIGPDAGSYPTPDGVLIFVGDELADVPWNQLRAGDVINLYYRATPYREKPVIGAQGTQMLPVVLWGVTDALGRRPIIDGDMAVTLPTTDGMMSATPEYGSDLAIVMVISPGPYQTKPTWVEVCNLHVRNAGRGFSYIARSGSTRLWPTGASGLRIGPANDVLVANCIFQGCGQGVFTVVRNDDPEEACYRITYRSNRFYENGTPNSYYEHNLYNQCASPRVIANFFGPLIPSAWGSTYKSRCSDEVFAYNYVVASPGRTIDWVQSEDSQNSIVLEPGYGQDVAFGNVILIDSNRPAVNTAEPLHYGGDNQGEDTATGTPLGNLPYRANLLFYNNTVLMRTTTEWRGRLLGLSLIGTVVHAWNNIFLFDGPAQMVFSWLDCCGHLYLHGANFIRVQGGANPLLDVDVSALGTGRYVIHHDGTEYNSATLFTNIFDDHRLATGSAAIGNGSATLPTTLPSAEQARAALWPVEYQLEIGRNGRIVRPNLSDIGALAYGTGLGPPPVIPSNTVAPYITGIYVAAQLLTANVGTWANTPTSYTYEWQTSTDGANWSSVSGETSSTYTPAAEGYVRVRVAASNAAGESSAVPSASVSVLPVGAPGFSLQPVPDSVEDGSTASFTVTLVGNATITQLWQVLPVGSGTWSTIDGATATSYETPALSTADNGRSYRCVATNSIATAYSNEVSVTVTAVSEPNAQGVFNFTRPDGTNLTGVNASFARIDGFAVQIEVQGNQIQCVDGTGTWGTVNTYPTGHSATDQHIKARVTLLTGGSCGIGINGVSGDRGYLLDINPTNYTVYRSGVWQASGAHGVDFGSGSAVFSVDRQASTITFVCNGTTVHTIEDGTPLTNTAETFALYCSGSDETVARIDSLTFTRSATL